MRHVFLMLAMLVASPALAQQIDVSAMPVKVTTDATPHFTRAIMQGDATVGTSVSVGETRRVGNLDGILIEIGEAEGDAMHKVRSATARIERVQGRPLAWLATGGGTHTIEIERIDFDKREWISEFRTVIIPGGDDDEPLPDDPEPDPDQDDDSAGESPFDGEGLRVLIVEETGNRTALPATQRAIFTSAPLRVWLNQNCARGPIDASGTLGPEWRILDDDSAFPDQCDTVWCKAFSRPREGTPWIIIGNGTSGYEGPLPLNVDETLMLLQKYAG